MMALVWFAPERLAGFKQQIVALFASLLAGLMAFFLTGDIGVERSWLKASGGLGAFGLILLLWPHLVSAPPSDIYRLRVIVLGPRGQPVEDAEVRSTVGGEKKKVEGGWEVDVSAGSLSADHKVTVYADKPSAFQHGYQEVTLDKDFQPVVPVKLKEDRSAKVTGRVEDGGGHSVEGARVWVEGHDSEAVTTGPGGEFALAAHAALDQMVRLHVKKSENEPPAQDQPAGRPVTLRLERP